MDILEKYRKPGDDTTPLLESKQKSIFDFEIPPSFQIIDVPSLGFQKLGHFPEYGPRSLGNKSIKAQKRKGHLSKI